MNHKSHSAWKQVDPDVRTRIVKSMTKPRVPAKPSYAKPLYYEPHKVNLYEISLHDFMISLNSNFNVEDEEVVEEIDTEDIASSEPPND